MSDKTITIAVRPNGDTKISAKGYSGETCVTATGTYERIFKDEAKPRQLVGGDGDAFERGEKVR